MKIFITGYSGFIGQYLAENLSNEYDVIKINLRGFKELSDKKKKQLFKKLDNNDVILNCAASLRPSDESDLYINTSFPIFLCDMIKKIRLKVKLIHLSSINTLQDKLKDKYTTSKKKSDQILIKNNVLLIRLPLIIEKDESGIIKPTGQISIFYKYLQIKLPFYPMIYPGNLFNPVDIKDLFFFIKSLITKKNSKGIYNLFGECKVSSWHLFQEIAISKKKKIFKININQFLSYIPKKIKVIIFKYNFLYNIFGNINFSDIEENKTFIKYDNFKTFINKKYLNK